MKRKGDFFKKQGLIIAASLLVQMSVYVLPCQAETAWHDFSRSLNSALTDNKLLDLENVLGFVLTALLFYLVFLFISRAESKKVKSAYQNRRSLTAVRPQGRSQNRYWFRMQTSAEFDWILADEALRAGKKKYNRDRLADISGGGLCFKTAVKLNPGDKIRFLIDVGRDKPMALNGKVVRTVEGNDSGMHKVAVQFINILSGERDRIASWIMRGQRAAINKKRQDDGVISS